ncbi:MAG: efflux transporter outer membrane subunit [Kiritimatiellaeota bacterium]|nr:efflux transporter outer membrane subunit [Kiritimatiellota bacterium]
MKLFPNITIGVTLSLAASLLLTGGCISVGPDYIQPQLPAVTNWSATLSAGVTAAPAAPETLSRWWAQLNDPVLSDLIERARAGNLDVRQTEARLRAARAQRGMAKAALFPTVGAAAAASRSRGSEESGNGDTANLFANGFDASWEMDIFGKNRRALESADATMQASQEAVNDALVSLFAEVALNYVEVRSDQLLIALTETNLATRAETCDITRWRHEAGLTTQLDVDQANLSLEQARAELPTLRTSLEKGQHRLAVLVGQPPGRLKELLAEPKAIPVPPLDIAVGVPADMLRHRPDIRQAERQLAAQTAQIGVAQAARYPDFSLLGSIGLESLSLGTLYNAGARTAQAAANATWTLFDGGSLRQAVEVQTALQEEALSLYEATVLTALEDVENALVAYANEQARRRALEAAVQAGQSAFGLARNQYTSGLVGFQTVLDMQRTLLSVQDQLVVSDAEVTANVIRLYKALGGGWTSHSSALATAKTNPSGDTP